MLIDWFTVGAQAINFIILVWLLKRFLYKPILDAVDARETQVAAELANADTQRADAKKQRDEFQYKNEEFDKMRTELLSKARAEAKAERTRLLDEARKAADAVSAKRQLLLRSDARSLSDSISQRTRQEVFAIARRALADLATTDLEEQIADVFIRRVRQMDDKTKAVLIEALTSASEPAIVRSAFDLTAEQHAAIQKALSDNFAANIRVRFETVPDLVSGIELTANGQKIGWSISDYLKSLENDVENLLKDRPEAKPQSKTLPIPSVQEAPKSDAKAASASGEPKPRTASQ